jgi:hypothetical protein
MPARDILWRSMSLVPLVALRIREDMGMLSIIGKTSDSRLVDVQAERCRPGRYLPNQEMKHKSGDR